MSQSLSSLLMPPGPEPERQRVPMLMVEALPGGFVITTQVGTDCRGPARRELVPNIDALVAAINRWDATEVRGVKAGQS